MKNIHTYKKQRGFFGLGLGLGLMLVFGGMGYTLTPDDNKIAENSVPQQASQTVTIAEESNWSDAITMLGE